VPLAHADLFYSARRNVSRNHNRRLPQQTGRVDRPARRIAGAQPVGKKVGSAGRRTSSTDDDLGGRAVSRQVGFVCPTRPLARFGLLRRETRLIGRLRRLQIVSGTLSTDHAAAQKNREGRCDKQSLQLLPPRSVPGVRSDRPDAPEADGPMVAPRPIKEASLTVPITH
jgi:hypothetical protein